MAKIVVDNGDKVIEGWPERIRKAQELDAWSIDGVKHPRMRYGSEEDDWGANRRVPRSRRDQGAISTWPGCDVERCQACGGQALYCDCPYDEDEA